MTWKRGLGLAVVVALLAAGCNRSAAPEPDVWAVVNDQPIRRAEVERYYQSRLNPQARPPSQEEALSLALNILDELISNYILIQRARTLGLEATDGEVEDRFIEFKSPFTEEEFERQLTERGLTVDDLRQDIRRQLTIQKLFNREVLSKISISDQDVSSFYEQNRAQFNVAETQYRIAQILITPRRDPQVRNRKNDDAATDLEARRKAAALLQQIRDGADFAQLAMDYSEDPLSSASGGDLGYIPESALQQSAPALRNAAMRLRAGEASDVIAQPEGYRILRLIAREAPGQRELTDPQVQQTIRDTLRTRKEQVLRVAYLAEARQGAQVTNYLARQVLESAGKLPVIDVKPSEGGPLPELVPESSAPSQPQPSSQP